MRSLFLYISLLLGFQSTACATLSSEKLLSRICGRIPVRVTPQDYDTELFESLCRSKIHTLFSW